MTNSIRKGKSFELQIARLLTEKTGKRWRRVPNSGGLGQDTTDNRMKGDVYCEHPKHQDLFIECKSWNALQLSQVFKDVSMFWRTIRKIQQQADDKPWLLFIKTNHRGVWIVTPDENQPYNLNLLTESITWKHKEINLMRLLQ